MTPEAKPTPAVEYRVLWVEYPAGLRVAFAGEVVDDFSLVHADYLAKEDTYGCHDVLIEARLKSDAEWPHPEDHSERWRARVPKIANSERRSREHTD